MTAEDANLPGMIGHHPAMRRVYRLVRAAAPTELSVVVIGETGTGKELVSRAIHALSVARNHRPFVDVNCAAIPEHLCEGEFFGWERGAFTGADRNNTGLMDMADGGTLFLDEVCTMPLHLQAKLLRAIEQQEYRRVGGRHPVHTRFRVVAAISEPVERLVTAGRLREDLAYRLAEVTVELPPLRKRGDDIRLLAEFFMRQGVNSTSSSYLTPGALRLLKEYHWPGNVRELKNAIGRLALFSGKATVSDSVITTVLPGILQPTCSRQDIERVLEEHGWRVSEAARAVGLPRSTLRDRMRVLGIRKPVGGGLSVGGRDV